MSRQNSDAIIGWWGNKLIWGRSPHPIPSEFSRSYAHGGRCESKGYAESPEEVVAFLICKHYLKRDSSLPGFVLLILAKLEVPRLSLIGLQTTLSSWELDSSATTTSPSSFSHKRLDLASCPPNKCLGGIFPILKPSLNSTWPSWNQSGVTTRYLGMVQTNAHNSFFTYLPASWLLSKTTCSNPSSPAATLACHLDVFYLRRRMS